MVQTAQPTLLNRGIYTPRQAARYARLHTGTLTRWIHGAGDGEAAVRAELAHDDDHFVTFLDFVQAMALRAIRLDRKIPLQMIRRVVDFAKVEYGLDYPFARRHKTYLFEDDVVLTLDDGTQVQATGKYKKHHCIHQVVEFYAEDLVYGEASKLAERYIALVHKDRKVILDPLVRFGEPVVYPCGMSAAGLVDAVKSEGSVEAAVEAFGVERDDIITAQRYVDCLLGVAA